MLGELCVGAYDTFAIGVCYYVGYIVLRAVSDVGVVWYGYLIIWLIELGIDIGWEVGLLAIVFCYL